MAIQINRFNLTLCTLSVYLYLNNEYGCCLYMVIHILHIHLKLSDDKQ